MKPFTLISAGLLFASAGLAQAQTSGTSGQPAPETRGVQGTESVQKNLDANKSDGHATPGLTNAEKHHAMKHGKSHMVHNNGAEERAEHSEKVERAEKPEHSERPERPEKPERAEH